MATNTERPRRFDLRTTIPLATETLIYIAKQPKRSWILPALTLITSMAFIAVMLELILSPSSASALGYSGELRSRLSANYEADPIVARIHELRLTIVEDVLGVDAGGGSEPPAIAMLMQEPVPTATPKATRASSATSRPSATPVPTDAPTETPAVTASPTPSDTPPPPTVPFVSDYCDNLSIASMKVDGDDVEAKVRNGGSRDVYLIETVFEWPDVPDPAYVDYFELDHIDGDDKYYTSNDWNSPTISTIVSGRAKLREDRRENWKVDFDDEPGGKIYGSFFLMLTFDVPGQDAHCSVSRSTFKAPPEPTDAPKPTNTPEPAPTNTLAPSPSDTPEPAPSNTPEPAPTNTPEPTNTSTPEPTATPG